MKEKTMGSLIAELRKAKGMTQLELANFLGVTDKAVSKWERDLSCPDVNTLPKLAQILGVSVDELLQAGAVPQSKPAGKWTEILDMILKAVPLAMGIALIVTGILKKDLDLHTVSGMAGIGLFAISLYQLRKEKG